MLQNETIFKDFSISSDYSLTLFKKIEKVLHLISIYFVVSKLMSVGVPFDSFVFLLVPSSSIRIIKNGNKFTFKQKYKNTSSDRHSSPQRGVINLLKIRGKLAFPSMSLPIPMYDLILYQVHPHDDLLRKMDISTIKQHILVFYLVSMIIL